MGTYNVVLTQLEICYVKMKNVVAYLLHARTVEPQKQLFLSNTRTQQ
jgi:hypothetical protein